MKQFYYILLLLFFSSNAIGQTYLKVSQLSGTQVLAGNTITVTPTVDTVRSHTACGAGPYRLNSCMVKYATTYTHRETGYQFAFEKPVRSVKFIISGMDSSAILGFYINGNFYPINNANISPSGTTCGFQPTHTSNGYLLPDTSAGGATVLLAPSGFRIDSVYLRVEPNNYDFSGVHFSVFFEADLEVKIPEFFSDTFMCINDSVHIGYETNLPFYWDNTFRAELSDINGSFVNPIVIGEKFDNLTGTIPCKIPEGIIRGSKYRVRVTSNRPALVTPDNGKDITISPFPSISATGPDSVCEGNPIAFSATNDQQSIITWRGPNNFSSTDLSPTIEHAILEANGKYIVSASNNTCTTRDTVDVVVKPTPKITDASSNSPICEDEMLTFSSKSDYEKARHYWIGPNDYRFDGRNANLNKALPTAGGRYEVIASLDGCKSDAAIVDVRIKPKPVINIVKTNSPVQAGSNLQLEVHATEGASFLWQGPDGFSDTISTIEIIEATNANEGKYSVTATLEGCSVTGNANVIITPNRNYKIFPNPADKDFEVRFFVEKDQIVSFQLLNTSGKTVYEEKLHVKKGFLQKSISASGLQTGIYFFKAIVDGEKINARISILK